MLYIIIALIIYKPFYFCGIQRTIIIIYNLLYCICYYIYHYMFIYPLFSLAEILGLTPLICGNEINPLGISVKLCYFWLYSNTIQTIPACMVSTIRKTSVIYTVFILQFPAIPLLSRLFATIQRINKLYRIVTKNYS